MNERIQELAEQAGMGHERWNTTVKFESFLEKFALAIVKECAKVIDDHYEPVYDGNFLKDHFGVE